MLTRATTTKSELITETCELLRRAPATETIEAFANILFAHAAEEDITTYSSRQLAAIARESWTRLQQRHPGQHRLTILASNDVPDLQDLVEPLTIIETSNDDMPFLLDSVLGELTERGCEIRFVLHPILSVQRELDGTLTQLIDRQTEGKRQSAHR